MAKWWMWCDIGSCPGILPSRVLLIPKRKPMIWAWMFAQFADAARKWKR